MIFKAANQFSPAEINTFKKIVLQADQVKAETFDKLIAKNPHLLFYPDSTKPQAVAALKIPNPEYKKKIFYLAQSGLHPDDFEYEMGWLVCLKPGQGIGQKVSKFLSQQQKKIYASCRRDNRKMIHILEKNGFQKSGNSYPSERGDYELELYILANSQLEQQ